MSDDSKTNIELELPRPEELKRDIRSSASEIQTKEDVFIEQFTRVSIRSERQYVHLKGLQEHYAHKSMWSYFIMFLMFSMISFQSFLLYEVGVGAWSFEKYTWLLPALLVQNLAQIVGLAVFVVKALFTKMDED